jgi:DNA ligase-1
MAQRLAAWTDLRLPPSASDFERLCVASDDALSCAGRHWPFVPILPLDRPASALGDARAWQAQWLFDGLRAQLVRRADRIWLWSQEDELLAEGFPEVIEMARRWPGDGVLEGQLLVWPAAAPAPLGAAQLQRRLARRHPPRGRPTELPVRFVAHDLLEDAGQDLRGLPLLERLSRLSSHSALAGLALSPVHARSSWPAFEQLRAQARQHGATGLLLRHGLSTHGPDREATESTWWNWTADALRIRAVLVYLQAGNGRPAGNGAGYSFAVWNRSPRDPEEAEEAIQAITKLEAPRAGGLRLVVIARAEAGLSEADRAELDAVSLRNVLQRFGPARSVKPTQVIELECDALTQSRRHKSGMAAQGTRMLRLRRDLPPHAADTLQALQRLMRGEPESGP